VAAAQAVMTAFPVPLAVMTAFPLLCRMRRAKTRAQSVSRSSIIRSLPSPTASYSSPPSAWQTNRRPSPHRPSSIAASARKRAGGSCCWGTRLGRKPWSQRSEVGRWPTAYSAVRATGRRGKHPAARDSKEADSSLFMRAAQVPIPCCRASTISLIRPCWRSDMLAKRYGRMFLL
jgi:hypothetical protein